MPENDMPEPKINEQIIFHFSHEQVEEALLRAIKDQLPPGVVYRCMGITDGLPKASGLTYTLQRFLMEPTP